MKLDFEYGHGLMSANLPDDTDVFIPGKTIPDPECLPQDWDSLYAATLDSLRHPMGMAPLRELATPGKTAVIVIPDIVKGGCQPTAHRKVSITACLEENGYAYPVVMDETGTLFYQYGISAYPTTFMIDTEGNVFGYVQGAVSREVMDDIVEQTRTGQRR